MEPRWAVGIAPECPAYLGANNVALSRSADERDEKFMQRAECEVLHVAGVERGYGKSGTECRAQETECGPGPPRDHGLLRTSRCEEHDCARGDEQRRGPRCCCAHSASATARSGSRARMRGGPARCSRPRPRACRRGTSCSSRTCSTSSPPGTSIRAGRTTRRPPIMKLARSPTCSTGPTDRVTVGMIPRFFYDEPAGAANSSGIDVGDLTLQAGYGLTRYQEGSSIPALAFVVRKRCRPAATTGCSAERWRGRRELCHRVIACIRRTISGCPTAASCAPAWISPTPSPPRVSVQDASVYGTPAGFHGHAYPGDGVTVDAAAEYSVTRNWVLAMDVVYQYNANTRVRGHGERAGKARAADGLGLFLFVGLRPGGRVQLERPRRRAARGAHHQHRPQYRDHALPPRWP